MTKSSDLELVWTRISGVDLGFSEEDILNEPGDEGVKAVRRETCGNGTIRRGRFGAAVSARPIRRCRFGAANSERPIRRSPFRRGQFGAADSARSSQPVSMGTSACTSRGQVSS